jgi:phosphatidylcholine synthase
MLPALLVHLLTASGAVLALAAVFDAFAGDYRRAFLWLAVTTAIDSVDGALARAAHVKERTPQIDGGRLDDIVDYLTFVFVPALVVVRAGLVPAAWGLPVASAMLLSSGYGFAQANAKTSDHFFTGFPSYWNVVVLYLYVLGLGPAVNAAILALLAVLVFVPIGYVYPSRTPTLRGVTIGLGAVWAVLVVAMIWMLPAPPRWLVGSTLVFPAYYAVLSFALHARRAAR